MPDTAPAAGHCGSLRKADGRRSVSSSANAIADLIDMLFNIGIPALIIVFVIYVIKGYRGKS
jgi:hypothetical protein